MENGSGKDGAARPTKAARTAGARERRDCAKDASRGRFEYPDLVYLVGFLVLVALWVLVAVASGFQMAQAVRDAAAERAEREWAAPPD